MDTALPVFQQVESGEAAQVKRHGHWIPFPHVVVLPVLCSASLSQLTISSLRSA